MNFYHTGLLVSYGIVVFFFGDSQEQNPSEFCRIEEELIEFYIRVITITCSLSNFWKLRYRMLFVSLKVEKYIYCKIRPIKLVEISFTHFLSLSLLSLSMYCLKNQHFFESRRFYFLNVNIFFSRSSIMSLS